MRSLHLRGGGLGVGAAPLRRGRRFRAGGPPQGLLGVGPRLLHVPRRLLQGLKESERPQSTEHSDRTASRGAEARA